MKEQQSTKKEKIQSVIIAILTLIIIFGGAYFASELKYCEVKEPVELQDINMSEFNTLLAADEASIIYVARPGCGFCQQQKPIVEEIVNEYGLAVYYLNTDNLLEQEANKLITMVEEVTKDDFGTPTTLVVKSGKIVDFVVGLSQKDSLVDFFTKNDLIK